MRLLSRHAPVREWFRTDEGLWASRPWSPEAREAYRSAGGWFQSGISDYTEHFVKPEELVKDKKCKICGYVHDGEDQTNEDSI